MPYIIAIVLVAVAALVFFSRPTPDEAATSVTTETLVPTEQVSESEVQEEATTDTSVVEAQSESTITTSPPPATETQTPPEPTAPAATAVTLSAESSYLTPARQEHELDVVLNLDGNIITAANVDYNGGEAKTPQHKAFDAVYQGEVIGKNINTLSLSRVGGSSLTTAAFNEAVAEIKTQL